MIPIENCKLTLVPGDGEWRICKDLPPDESYSWVEQRDGYTQHMRSDRLGYMDADISGTADEMRDLASAILANGKMVRKRVAVECTNLGVYLYSPKNSHTPTMISWGSARALVDVLCETFNYFIKFQIGDVIRVRDLSQFSCGQPITRSGEKCVVVELADSDTLARVIFTDGFRHWYHELNLCRL